MKRILAAFLVLVSAVYAMAQEHLSFKGIPIEGSMTSFCQKLKDQGLTEIGTTNNVTMFVGNFTGRQASIGVSATSNGKNVLGVIVIFDSSDEWKTLVNTYDYYKGLYTRKYGNPSDCIENNPSRHDSNTFLMSELAKGTVNYASSWEVTGGEIELSIEEATTPLNGTVVIKYLDAQNIEMKLQNDLDEI